VTRQDDRIEALVMEIDDVDAQATLSAARTKQNQNLLHMRQSPQSKCRELIPVEDSSGMTHSMDASRRDE
jgi:hypothetical protein